MLKSIRQWETGRSAKYGPLVLHEGLLICKGLSSEVWQQKQRGGALTCDFHQLKCLLLLNLKVPLHLAMLETEEHFT